MSNLPLSRLHTYKHTYVSGGDSPHTSKNARMYTRTHAFTKALRAQCALNTHVHTRALARTFDVSVLRVPHHVGELKSREPNHITAPPLREGAREREAERSRERESVLDRENRRGRESDTEIQA